MGNNSLLAKLFSKRRVLGGLLTIAIVVGVQLVFVFFTYTAGAAYWNVRSQGDCASGYPRGDSWLNWDGYGGFCPRVDEWEAMVLERQPVGGNS